MASTVFSCRWDWCRSSFPNIDALDAHVKHDHIWPMLPMRKAEIALMRKLDLQSLHSSQTTESSFISRVPGPFTPMSQRTTTPPVPPPTSKYEPTGSDDPDTSAQLSSPPQTSSPPRPPVSRTLEGLVGQDGLSGLSAAVEMFERIHGHKSNPRHRLPHRHSSTHRPHSWSSTSSQEVVEQQLTQDDDVGSQPRLHLPLPELQIENELEDTELKWPTDDESIVHPEEIGKSEQPVFEPPAASPDPSRGQISRHGSFNVPLDTNTVASPLSSSDVPPDPEQSQSFVLQTQAPYSSQAISWSQTQ